MKRKKTVITLFGAVVVLLLATLPAMGATFYLQAESFAMVMPDGVSVTMWGFAPYTDGTFTTPSATVSVPGPWLVVPPGDTDLVVTIKNTLTEPISLVVNGLQTATAMVPVMFTDSQTRQRVHSFTHETASGAVGTYTYANVTPGTFLYQSGTHISKQIPMGLYGGVKKNAAAGQAYGNPAPSFDSEELLIYSEVDPVLNNAASAGPVGTTAYPSPVSYAPRYFLINGNASLTVKQFTGTAGQTVWLRMINAGLTTRVPLLQAHYMTVYAEDGTPYAHPQERYQVTLPAAKTMDVYLTPAATGTVMVTDRRGYASLGTSGVVGPHAVCSTGTPIVPTDPGATIVNPPAVVTPLTPATDQTAATTTRKASSGGMCFIGSLSAP